ncbi:prepilin peptidase [Candidatus Pacearchaeota archaeon]|nr:prepilin peptidase [Candidatus Pacearchaeota archaeon]
MQEYYFLFAMAFLWTVFAVIQDLKNREVANWLNFSLIAFALAYRAFYASLNSNLQFFLLGIFGFAIFFILAHALYYAKAFAGGDAKLLIAYGSILPYKNYLSLLYIPLLFTFLLFLIGAVYSILYSSLIIAKNRETFNAEFKKRIKKQKYPLIISLTLFIVSVIYSFYNSKASFFIVITIIPAFYIYIKSVEKCMLKFVAPNKLTEGDWLEEDVKVGKKIIRKTVHGLSLEEIKLLKKHHKKILIKEGIPFTPSFLITLIIIVIMVFFSLTSKIPFEPFLPS